ncbi:MAG: OsmC family protein [Betaproteobacteria bacterium]|nr:OsmC family protein [Betaproteobacteria bacterium]
MKIVLHSEQDLTLEDGQKEGFEIVTEDSETAFGALQMFGASLALCTFSVLVAYGEQIHAGLEGSSVRVRWEYVEEPYRVGHIDMDIVWPGLPGSRVEAAKRAASLCTIHNTLLHPPQVQTQVRLK